MITRVKERFFSNLRIRGLLNNYRKRWVFNEIITRWQSPVQLI